MTTRPNTMMTLVISAAASALILANSAPAQAGGHHGMMGRASHPNSQQGMISNSPSSTKSSMYDNASSPTKSSMYDVKTNTGTSSSGTKGTMYDVKMNEIPSPWQSGKVKGLKSLTTKGNDAGGTQSQGGKGSTVTNSQLTSSTPPASKFIQKQAIFGNQPFPFTHPKGTPVAGAGSETGTGTGATKFNPKDVVFGNQPYTHPREATGTGAGSDTGTGGASSSGSGKTGSDVTTANAGNSQAQSTVVTPPSPFPVLGNRNSSDLVEGSAVTDPGTTITSSGGYPQASPNVGNPKTGEEPANWPALLKCPNDREGGIPVGEVLAEVWDSTPVNGEIKAFHWQCIDLSQPMKDWPAAFRVNAPAGCPDCPTMVYDEREWYEGGVTKYYWPDGREAWCFPLAWPDDPLNVEQCLWL